MSQAANENKQMDLSFKIADPSHQPNDTVQVLKFCPNNPQILAAGCWDDTVRVYQLQPTRNLTQQINQNLGAPVLDLAWNSQGNGLLVATGAASNNLVFVNLASPGSQPTPIGTHPGVLNLQYMVMNQTEILVTLGGDKTLRFWMLAGGRWEQKVSIPLKKTPSCMEIDMSAGLLLVGVESEIGIYRLNKLMNNDTSIQYITSSLGSPINCISIRDRATEVGVNDFKPNERIFVACASDGRANMVNLSLDTPQSNKTEVILFKAHSKGQNLYSINACGFSKLSHYCMYTCGSDGQIYFWDVARKGKLSSYIVAPNIPVSAADLSRDQTLFAFSCGYDWAQGVWGVSSMKIKPNIFIHVVDRKDLKRD